MKAHESAIRSLYFTNSGNTLISLSRDDLKIWSLPRRQLLGKITDKSIANVAVSPDNRSFAISENKNIEIRSLKNSSLIKSFNIGEGKAGFKSFSYSPDGKFLFAISYESNKIRLWDCLTGKSKALFPDHFNDYTYSIMYTPNGKLIVTTESKEEPSANSKTMSLNIRYAEDGKLIRRLQEFTSSEGNSLLMVSHDSKRLFFKKDGHMQVPLEIWNLEEMKMEYYYQSTAGEAFALSPDGLKIFTTEKNSVQMWESPVISNVQKKILDMLATTSFENLKNPVPDCCTHGINSGAYAIAVSPVETILASGDANGVIKLSNWEIRECMGFVFDPRVNEVDGISYTVYNKETSNTIFYTVPYGSTIPKNAHCTCNSVAGTKPVYEPEPIRSKGSCSCVPICTCIPVCQAHRLLDQDPAVRVMAEEILLTMGKKEWAYLEWAFNEANTLKLKYKILQVMNLVSNDVQPVPSKWPDAAKLKNLLSSTDRVISLMAAQMFNLLHFKGQHIPLRLLLKVESVLLSGYELHWRIKKY